MARTHDTVSKYTRRCHGCAKTIKPGIKYKDTCSRIHNPKRRLDNPTTTNRNSNFPVQNTRAHTHRHLPTPSSPTGLKKNMVTSKKMPLLAFVWVRNSLANKELRPSPRFGLVFKRCFRSLSTSAHTFHQSFKSAVVGASL